MLPGSVSGWVAFVERSELLVVTTGACKPTWGGTLAGVGDPTVAPTPIAVQCPVDNDGENILGPWDA
mgnify:CR=1 FL=1